MLGNGSIVCPSATLVDAGPTCFGGQAEPSTIDYGTFSRSARFFLGRKAVCTTRPGRARRRAGRAGTLADVPCRPHVGGRQRPAGRPDDITETYPLSCQPAAGRTSPDSVSSYAGALLPRRAWVVLRGFWLGFEVVSGSVFLGSCSAHKDFPVRAS